MIFLLHFWGGSYFQAKSCLLAFRSRSRSRRRRRRRSRTIRSSLKTITKVILETLSSLYRKTFGI
ncbi:hypothetical protein ACMBCN_01130 [Candidatus Liberibacter asiaticus]|nr:hypothetical protein [Candidatus Liberibacter asiaticus]